MVTPQELAAEFISIYFKNPSEEVIKAVEKEFIPIFALFLAVQKTKKNCCEREDDHDHEDEDEYPNIEKYVKKLASIFIKEVQEDYSLFTNQTAENPVSRKYSESDYLDSQCKKILVFQMENVIIEIIEDFSN
jgi:hypothetical protein